MPVGKIEVPRLNKVAGIRLATIEAAIRYPERKDLVLFALDNNARLSAVFTQNHFCAAPVLVCREHLKKAVPKYLIINTGNANAGTGDTGLQAAQAVCQALAEKTGVTAEQILPFSTGVTAEQLPVNRITDALDRLIEKLHEDGWNAAAEGIMTTDTVPKGASVSFDIDGEKVTITGISKGSGMIRPDMATMLSFIATDADIAKAELDKMLKTASDKSFNRITIDGDTSTNDSCVLMASCTGAKIDTDKGYDKFLLNLTELMQTLAQNMVRDAEGASKFISVKIGGGLDSAECLEAAYSIAHSPLVKAAFFASDPNWGRIMVALGNARIKNLDIRKINARLGEVKILENGAMAADYTEAAGSQVMQKQEIAVQVDLGRGQAEETVWTSDLSHEYVTINADYRT